MKTPLSRWAACLVALGFCLPFARRADAGLKQVIPSFEKEEKYVLGNIHGQRDWFSPGNSPSLSVVTNAPPGTPGFLGARSLLVADWGRGYGAITGTVTPMAPDRAGQSDALPAPTAGNRYHTEFWFRTAMASAPTSNYPRFVEMNIGSMRYAQIGIGNPSAGQLNNSNPTTWDAAQDSANGSLRLDLGYYTRIYNPSNDANYYLQFLRKKLADNLTYGAWYKLTVDAVFNDGGWYWTNGATYATGTPLGNDELTVALYDAAFRLVATTTGGTWEGPFTWPAFGATSNTLSVGNFQWRVCNPGLAAALALPKGGALYVDNVLPRPGTRLVVR